jgi:hypothetical protein
VVEELKRGRGFPSQTLANITEIGGFVLTSALTRPRFAALSAFCIVDVAHDQEMFAAERTLDSLADAGYRNGFEGLPSPERVTHPGTHGFPDATF